MEFIKSDDLNNIFKNISDRKPRVDSGKSSGKNITDIKSGIYDSNLLDNGVGKSNRTHPGVLHQDLLSTLISNKEPHIVNKYSNCKVKKELPKYNCHEKSRTTKRNQGEIKHPLVLNKAVSDKQINKNSNIDEDESKLITVINLEHNLNLSPYKCPDDELHQVLYYLVSSVIPEFSSYGKELRLKYYKNLREKIAYDLDERELYQKYSYKKLFNKTDIQNKLLSSKPIYDKWFLRYLSDYFDINIGYFNEWWSSHCELVVIKMEYCFL